MNLDALWQQHRSFIVGVTIGIVVFLIGRAVVGSTAKADLDRAERQIRTFKGKLKGSSYSAQQVAQLEGHLQDLQERGTALSSVTLAPLRAEFSPASGQSSGQHYIQWTGQLRDELIAFSLRNNVDVEDTLGIPDQQPAQVDQMESVMRGLDVVDRVVRMAVVAGAASVEDIDIRLRSSRSRGRATADQALSLIPVSCVVVFRGNPVLPFAKMLLEESDGKGPLGLSRLEIEEQQPRKKQRRVILEFSVGGMPVGDIL